MTKIALCSALILLPLQAIAQEAQHSLKTAMHARITGHPDRALQILVDLEEKSPLNAHIKFEKGVTLAELGKCASAARTFNAGKQLTPLPSYRRAVDAAMGHLCPRLAPFETSLGASFIMDSNSNSGSESNTVEINGTTFQLSDDAIARSGSHLRINARIAYNYQISHRGYLVPEASISAAVYNKSKDTTITPGVSLAYRYRGDRHDFRFGPTVGWSFDGNGQTSQNLGLFAAGNYAINGKSALKYHASYTNKDLKRSTGSDTSTFGSVAYHRSVANGRRLLTMGYSFGRTDSVNYMNDLDQHTISVSMTGMLSEKFGYEAYASHSWVFGDQMDPFFGVKRQDKIAKMGVNFSMPALSSILGRPYVGISYVNSQSTFATKKFDNVQVSFGLTKSF